MLFLLLLLFPLRCKSRVRQACFCHQDAIHLGALGIECQYALTALVQYNNGNNNNNNGNSNNSLIIMVIITIVVVIIIVIVIVLIQ